MQFFKTPNIEFVGNGRKAVVLSAILLLVGVGSMAVHKGRSPSPTCAAR
jgi:hypothetical protein